MTRETSLTATLTYLKEMRWIEPVVVVALGGIGRFLRIEIQGECVIDNSKQVFLPCNNVGLDAIEVATPCTICINGIDWSGVELS